MYSFEYDVIGGCTCTVFSLLRIGIHSRSSATLGLILFTLTIMVFLSTHALPLSALELYSRWPLCKIVNHSSGILISEIPITSHTNLVSLSSSSSSYTC